MNVPRQAPRYVAPTHADSAMDVDTDVDTAAPKQDGTEAPTQDGTEAPTQDGNCPMDED